MGDIFDPIHCTNAYNRCATVEQIQTFLWQQIQRVQGFCNDFNNHQNIYNSENSAKVTANTNAINNINNQINSLKTLQDNLSTQMSTLQKDNNAFKLAVDNTLALYQTSINDIVKNIDKLTIDGQALQNRVGILESQTDLAKLQQIIKSYEEIKAEFASQLKAESDKLYAYVNKAISDMNASFENYRNSINSSFNVFKSEVNQSLANMNTTVTDSNASVMKLTALYKELHEYINAVVDDHATDIIALREELQKYTQDNLAELEKELRNAIENTRVELQNNINKLTTDSDTKFIKINERIDAFEAVFNEAIKEYSDKFSKILEISREIEKENHHINHRLDNALKLVFQANESAKEAVTGLINARHEYDGKFIKYDYKLKRMQESIQYINSSIVRGFIEEEGLYNIKIALLEAIDGHFKLSSKFYSFVIKLPDGSNSLVKEYDIMLDAVNYNEYKVIADDSYDEYRLIVRAYTINDEIKYGIDVKHIDNEFNQIEFPIQKIIREEDKDYNDIVDTPIHKVPEPVEPPKEECDAMKVIIVNDKCEPTHCHDHEHNHCKPPLPKPPATLPDVLDRLPTETYAEWMCRLSEWALKLKEINDVTPIPSHCSIVDGETGVVFPPPQDGKDGKDGVGIKDIEITVHEKENVDIIKEKDIGSNE